MQIVVMCKSLHSCQESQQLQKYENAIKYMNYFWNLFCRSNTEKKLSSRIWKESTQIVFWKVFYRTLILCMTHCIFFITLKLDFFSPLSSVMSLLPNFISMTMKKNLTIRAVAWFFYFLQPKSSFLLSSSVYRPEPF